MPNGRDHALSGDAGNGRLAGGVDIEHADGVGVRECGAEFVEQVAGARVAMRLEDHVDALESALPRRRKGRTNLRGMMAVVVNHADAVHRALELKAPVHAAEFFESFADFVRRNVQPYAYRDRSRSVQHIVVSGNLQMEIAQ